LCSAYSRQWWPYSCIYFVCTSVRAQLQQSEKPELAWLKEEFKLSDAEFQARGRASRRLPSTMPGDVREIDSRNAKLEALLSEATNHDTGDHRRPHREFAAALECQAMMLRHFFEVSQTMPPVQGRRYLAWGEGKGVPAELRHAEGMTGAALTHDNLIRVMVRFFSGVPQPHLLGGRYPNLPNQVAVCKGFPPPTDSARREKVFCEGLTADGVVVNVGYQSTFTTRLLKIDQNAPLLC